MSIHETAIVHPTASIGARASIGAGAIIGAWASIGTRARISTNADVLCIAPIGRSGGCLSAYRIEGGGYECSRGCFRGDIAALAAEVQAIHGNDQNGREYQAAIALIRARFDQ